jgi:small subunit ribosomal protein S20
MPNTKSATKALRVSLKKASRNRRYVELYKESLKSFEKITSGEKQNEKDVMEALSKLYSRIDTLDKKNIIHQNNAANRKSRFAKRAQKFLTQ